MLPSLLSSFDSSWNEQLRDRLVSNCPHCVPYTSCLLQEEDKQGVFVQEELFHFLLCSPRETFYELCNISGASIHSLRCEYNYGVTFDYQFSLFKSFYLLLVSFAMGAAKDRQVNIGCPVKLNHKHSYSLKGIEVDGNKRDVEIHNT